MIVQSCSPNAGAAELASLLYASRVTIDPDQLALTLADIQTQSVARNTAHDITGLLIATPRYFAQLLEGPSSALDAVLFDILTDRHHADIQVLQRGTITARIGQSWRLIRFNPGSFEERHVTPVIERAHRDASDENADALMRLVHRLLVRSAGQSALHGRASAGISER